MSVRNALLALVAQHPRHGYQLKADFEQRTGGTWPLNIGQVYTTLRRLERDGLVAAGEPADDGTVRYSATPAGAVELQGWWRSPVGRPTRSRDELTIKLALAVTMAGVDLAALVQAQRTATVRWLQDLTRLKRTADESGDLAWALVLDRMLFEAEAESRWLDHVEGTVLRRGAGRPAASAASAEPAASAGPAEPAASAGPAAARGGESVGTSRGGRR